MADATGGPAAADGGTTDRTADGESANRGTDGVSTYSSRPARPPRLLAPALAAVHVALLVVAGLTVDRLTGGIGGPVTRLGTGAWAGLLVLLMVTTWWTTRRWLLAAWSVPGESPPDGGWPDLGTLVTLAAMWGGLTGAIFFLGLLALTLGPEFLRAGPGSYPVFVLAAIVGSLPAFAVGSVLAGLLALLDLGCWRVGERLLGAG